MPEFPVPKVTDLEWIRMDLAGLRLGGWDWVTVLSPGVWGVRGLVRGSQCGHREPEDWRGLKTGASRLPGGGTAVGNLFLPPAFSAVVSELNKLAKGSECPFQKVLAGSGLI